MRGVSESSVRNRYGTTLDCSDSTYDPVVARRFSLLLCCHRTMDRNFPACPARGRGPVPRFRVVTGWRSASVIDLSRSQGPSGLSYVHMSFNQPRCRHRGGPRPERAAGALTDLKVTITRATSAWMGQLADPRSATTVQLPSCQRSGGVAPIPEPQPSGRQPAGSRARGRRSPAALGGPTTVDRCPSNE